MKMKAIGIPMIALMGLTASVWAVDTATAPAQEQISQKEAAAMYVCADDRHDNCQHDANTCRHWTRWTPGHQNRCGWSSGDKEQTRYSMRCCR